MGLSFLNRQAVIWQFASFGASVTIYLHIPVEELKFPSAKFFKISSIFALLPFIFQLPPTKNFLSILISFTNHLKNATIFRPERAIEGNWRPIPSRLLKRALDLGPVLKSTNIWFARLAVA